MSFHQARSLANPIKQFYNLRKTHQKNTLKETQTTIYISPGETFFKNTTLDSTLNSLIQLTSMLIKHRLNVYSNTSD